MVFLRIIAIAACIFCVEGRCASGDDAYESLKSRVAAQRARFLAGNPDFEKLSAVLDDWLSYAHTYDTDLETRYKKLIHTIHTKYRAFGDKLKNNPDFAQLKKELDAFIVDREMAVKSLEQRIAKIKESKFQSRFKRYTAQLLEQILALYHDLAQKLREGIDGFEKSMASKT